MCGDLRAIDGGMVGPSAGGGVPRSLDRGPD